MLEERNPQAGDAAREALRLLEALQEAAEIEWRAAPVVRAAVEAERTSGGREIANPTLDVATDVRRMAVRVAVWGAWRALHDSRLELERAVVAWNGGEL